LKTPFLAVACRRREIVHIQGGQCGNQIVSVPAWLDRTPDANLQKAVSSELAFLALSSQGAKFWEVRTGLSWACWARTCPPLGI
jgi:hypothetical protein